MCSSISMKTDESYFELVEKQIEYADSLRIIATGEQISNYAKLRLQNDESKQSGDTPIVHQKLKHRIAFMQDRIKSIYAEIDELQMQQQRLDDVCRSRYPELHGASVKSLLLALQEIAKLTEEQIALEN